VSPIARLKQKYSRIYPDRDAYSSAGHVRFYWTYAKPIMDRLLRYTNRHAL
jgi:hypothetical protein